MKRYLIPVVAILVVASGLAMGCRGAVPISETAIERDKAVAFYKGALPITKEIRQVVDDWNAFLQQFSERKVTNEEILRTVQEYVTRLEALPENLSAVYAPPPLRQLKDDIASAVNTGIEGFSLYQHYALTNDIGYSREADQKLMECNRLMMRIADEWDDGLTHYNIKPSEILP